MDADAWNERYAAAERVWSVEPNIWFAEVAASLPPGRALDLACGEGRNAVWLAERGWHVTAIDFAGVALDRGRAASSAVEWVEADVRRWVPPRAAFDLVGIVYLHLSPDERRTVLASAVAALAASGTLAVIGHDVGNLAEGVGGPQDATILLSPDAVARELAALGVEVTRAGVVERPTDAGTALDTLVVAQAVPLLGGSSSNP